MINSLFKNSMMSPRFRQSTFKGWVERKGTDLAFKGSVQYVKDWEKNFEHGEGLTLYGPPGNGKSHWYQR